MRATMLLAFALFNLANATTQTEVVIKNDTHKSVHIDHFTDHYSSIPEDIDLADATIEPGQKVVVRFSVISTILTDYLSQLRKNEIEEDGIYLTIEGEPFGITWCAEEELFPSFIYDPIAHTERLTHNTVILNRVKSKKREGPLFVFTLQEKKDAEEYL